ncbi:glucose dehydrogenase [Lecanosticta acicola]|uniref:Glucose dehydrogenase n=1 Tax=Lecanosticta acicola TaxID=111012 RepID=A0AAI9EE51_9PEZI|nr:glucose dehydrogenase [Lecanosticta acicola]
MADEEEFDYIICGGGTAGCVLASRLRQANPSLSIALIERGTNDASNAKILNPLSVAELKSEGLQSVYWSTPQPHLSNRRIELHGGNVLSGSSATNYGVWMRGHRKDYDEWARITGDERWSYGGLLPYFKRNETHFDSSGDEAQHGFRGPIKTALPTEFPLRKPFMEAFEKLGYQSNPDQNGGNPFGYGTLAVNWSPRRQPASLAYDLSGVHVLCDSYAKKILLERAKPDEEPRAIGVQVGTGEDQVRQLRARKEVIVSCGAYRTPQLLMLSGIGPRQQLLKFAVSVVVDNAEVGCNMFDHLGCSICFKLEPKAAEKGLAMGHPNFMANPKFMEIVPCETSTIDMLDPRKLAEALQADSGTATISTQQLDALQEQRAHLWILPAYMPISLGENYDVVPDGEHISILMMNFQPTSRGAISLTSGTAADTPAVNPNYVTTQHDRLVMREGVRRILQLVEQSSLRPYVAAEEPPIGQAPLTSTSTDEEIDSRIQDNSTSIQHPAGTAAMGKVVDSQLRVKGVKGLRVCDASVFPAPVAATTQASVYALAESFADLLLLQEESQ